MARGVLVAGFLLLCSCDESNSEVGSRFSSSTRLSDNEDRETVTQPDLDDFRLTTRGPLQIHDVRRLNLPPNTTGNFPPVISPDGVNFLTYNAIDGLWINRIMSRDEAKRPVRRVTFEGFGFADTIPFAWADGSQKIFGARQETVNPSGFALGPMAPIEISIDGRVRDLPDLMHPAGTLDGLLWVGGRGKALALFGSGGGFYRPEVENHAPTIAIVDGREGKVLQSTPMPMLTAGNGSLAILAIDARIDADGRLFVLMWMSGDSDRGRWFVWHQNAPLRETRLDVERPGSMPFSVSPDTKTVLVMHNLTATGIVCETWSRQECPPLTPVTGTVADLRDVNTGQILWSLEGTAANFSRSLKPAISKDGTLALISLPMSDGAASVALISMQDGRILQRLDGIPTVVEGLGFGNDDRTVWLSGLDMVLTYQLSR